MYERVAGDYATFRVTRRGDTNAPSFTVNFTWSGTARSRALHSAGGSCNS